MSDLDDRIAALEKALDDVAAGTSTARIREGNRELAFRDLNPGELRVRLAELKAERDGRPCRQRARRVYF
jgi:hypothetical protein